MKKRIILLIILAILIFIAYKEYMLIKYSTNEVEIKTTEIFKDEISITSKDYKDLFTYENISFKNDFKDYVKNDNDWYIKKDKDNRVTSAIYITKMSQYYNLLTDGNLEMFNSDENKEIVDTFFKEKDKNRFIKEKNISSDIDLLNYIKDNYYFKNNILTCSKEIKENYIINSFVEIVLPTFSKITLINKDLSGYIFHASEKIRQIHILNNNRQFIITLVGENLVKDEYITNFLESIKIS